MTDFNDKDWEREMAQDYYQLLETVVKLHVLLPETLSYVHK
jgi:hypothetical protein